MIFIKYIFVIIHPSQHHKIKEPSLISFTSGTIFFFVAGIFMMLIVGASAISDSMFPIIPITKEQILRQAELLNKNRSLRIAGLLVGVLGFGLALLLAL